MPRRTLAYVLVDLNKIIQGAQTGMLTTRASDGHLHSRAMTPASREAQLTYMISSRRLMTRLISHITQLKQIPSLQML